MSNKLMFPIYLYDGGNMPKDDICYIITKKGPMIKKNLGMVESLVPVTDISILKDLQSYVKLNIPKIPEDLIANTYIFFKAIYNKHHAESIVLIFYNEKTKEYIIEPPPQTGNSASLNYTKGTIQHDGYNLIGTIHSHGSMSAFHSGTDHDDEFNFDGLHITFGNVTSDEFTLSCSVVSNGFRSIVEPEQYMEGIEKIEITPEKPKDYTVTRYRYDHHQKKTVPYQVKMKNTYQPKIQIKYKMTVPNEKLIFDKTWMNQFKYEKWTSTYKKWGTGRRSYGYNMFLDDDDWSAWGIPPAGKPTSPLNVGPSQNITPVNFDGNNPLDKNSNPCEKCVFLKHKLEWALNYFDWEEDDDDNDLIIEDDDYLMADADTYLDTIDDDFIDPDDDVMIVSTEDADILDRDDGSMMYDPDIHDMVEDQHNSDDFLHGKSHEFDDEPYDGKEIPTPDEVPQFSLTEWLKQRVANARNKRAN